MNHKLHHPAPKAYSRPILLLSGCFFAFLYSSACTQVKEADAPLDQGEVASQADFILDWRGPEYTHPVSEIELADQLCFDEGSEKDEFYFENPIPLIRKLGREHRVIIINESHYRSVHRVFIKELISELSDQGFTHYGSELFHSLDNNWLNSDDGLRKDGLLPKGYDLNSYWDDPTFGQIIEELSKTSTTFFRLDYDTIPPTGYTENPVTYREERMAQNLLEYIGNHGPDQKFIVHVGWAHAKEDNGDSGIEWMAEIFKRRSGLDPLTITQTDCFASKEVINSPLGYGLLMTTNGYNTVSRNGFDLVVAAPPGKASFERPVWLEENFGRYLIAVPDELGLDDYPEPVLITARNIAKPDSAPFEDMIYLRPNSDKKIALRPGTYEVVALNSEKEVISSKTVHVDEADQELER